MMDFLIKLRKFVSPKILFVNIAILLAIKFAVPMSGLHFATLYDQYNIIDSRQIISHTNSARAQENLPALKTNTALDLAAFEKLNDMIKNKYFAHTSPSGVSPWHWFIQNNYQYKTAGENLAVGFSTSADTIKAWLNSAGHRANLLNTGYEEIGVATAYGDLGQSRHGVIVVQLFGTPIKTGLASAPKSPVSPTTAPQTPAPTVAFSPQDNPILGESTNTEPVEISIPAVSPITIDYESSKTPDRINFIYIFYLSLVAVALGISIITHGLHKRTLLMAGAHLVLIALTVFLPALEIVSLRLIV